MKIAVSAACGIALLCMLAHRTAAWAQTGLQRPQMGVMLARDGSAHPAYGVTASTSLGDPVATGVLAIACSSQFCLMKADSAILALGISALPTRAPAGPALLALDGNSAFVYFTETRQLARWHQGELDPISWEPPGEVMSIRAEPPANENGALDVIFRRAARTWIGQVKLTERSLIVTGSLPDDSSPALLVDNGVLYADRGRVRLRRPDGSELSFPVTGAEAMFQLGDRYVQVRAGAFDYAIRIDPGHEQLFLLPEPVLLPEPAP